MAAKPRIVVFTVIPRVGELIKLKLPDESVKVVHFSSREKVRYGYGCVSDEISQIEDAEILVGDTGNFGQLSDKLSCLKWFQGTWAGVESLVHHFKDKKKPLCIMTRMSTQNFCQLMAEYVVGQILLHERDWIKCHYHQLDTNWCQSGTIATYRSLKDLTVGVLGIGNNGTEICRSLKAFRCRVLGYSRTAKPFESLKDLMDAHFYGDGLKSVVGESDYIVSCLPHTTATTGILSSDILQQAKKGSVLMNVGRSNVFSVEDLINCLDNGPLAHAILDVFENEPLATSSPLWLHPKITLTPHCSALSRPEEIAQVFVDNYRRFQNKEELHFQIDLEREY